MPDSRQLKKEYNQLSADKRTCEDRLKELCSIQSTLVGRIDSDVDDVNNRIARTRNGLSDGLRGTSAVSRTDAALGELRQGHVQDDSCMSDACDNIAREISRCRQKISDLEIQMGQKKGQIQEAETIEREVRKSLNGQNI